MYLYIKGAGDLHGDFQLEAGGVCPPIPYRHLPFRIHASAVTMGFGSKGLRA